MAVLADSVIDWAALFEVVWSALAAGVGIAAVFALGILGATRTVDMRRDGHALAAGLYGLLAAVALAAVAAALVLAIIVMTQK